MTTKTQVQISEEAAARIAPSDQAERARQAALALKTPVVSQLKQ